MSSLDTRYWYIQDAFSPHRTLTVARRKAQDVLYVTWCINKVQIDHSDRTTKDKVRIIVKRTYIDDAFSRRAARRICDGRLDVGRAIVVPAPAEGKTHDYLQAIYDEMLKPWQQWEWVAAKYAERTSEEGPALANVAALLRRSVHD